MRRVCLVFALLLAACSRPGDGRFGFHLERPSLVVLTLETGMQRLELLKGEKLLAGNHRAEVRGGKFILDGKLRGEVPAGTWRWRAYCHEDLKPVLRGWVGQPGPAPWDSVTSWAAADGAPSAVAADERSVYLGSSAGEGSGALVAVDLQGNLRWNHQREGRGVHAIGTDGGAVFVLADANGEPGGSMLYKLDAGTGAPVPWGGRTELDLMIASLWPSDAGLSPKTADTMAVGNGRIYLSFTAAGFMAVLDASDGHYVTTVSGPQPAHLAVSTTPTRGEDGKEQIADFGVIVLARSALSYFLMPHDAPWVAANTTHRLGSDEKVTAFTMRADTMKTGEIQLFLALDAPYSGVQMRPGTDPAGFLLTVGTPGGRPTPLGPWTPEALREVRSLAVDADGKLWVAEGDSWPRRFSVWTTVGKQSTLVREFFPAAGPSGRGAAIFAGDPELVVASGCEWKLDRSSGQASCVAVISRDGMSRAVFLGDRPVLVSAHGSGLSFYERRAPGEWRLLAELAAAPGSEPTYWADIDGDSQRQPEELRSLKLTPEQLPHSALADGTLIAGDTCFRLNGWTPSGAPNFDWDAPLPLPPADEGRTLLAEVVPEHARPTLVRTVDGRAFFVLEESAASVLEIEGAKSLRKLGEGFWTVVAR